MTIISHPVSLENLDASSPETMFASPEEHQAHSDRIETSMAPNDYQQRDFSDIPHKESADTLRYRKDHDDMTHLLRCTDAISALAAGYRIYNIDYQEFLTLNNKDHDRDRGKNFTVLGFMPCCTKNTRKRKLNVTQY